MLPQQQQSAHSQLLQLHTFSEQNCFKLENIGHMQRYCFFGAFFLKALFELNL
jgi:hypothetical protein